MITRKMRLSMAMLTIAASVLTTGNIKAAQTVNMDAAGVIRSSYPCYIQYEYEQPFTCRNIEIVLNGNNYQAHRLKVMASDDGVNYLSLIHISEPTRP